MFFKYTLIFVVTNFLCCFHLYGQNNCNPFSLGIGGTLTFSKNITLTRKTEILYLTALRDAEHCLSNKGAIYRAKFELASYWANFGYKLRQAEQLQKEVIQYYAKRSKWNLNIYYSSQYSLAEIYYKQGRFYLSLSVIEQLRSQLKIKTIKNSNHSANSKTLKMLLAIALEGIATIEPIDYQWKDDFHKITSYINDFGHWPIGRISRIGIDRDPFTRLLRWFNYLNTFSTTTVNYQTLYYLDRHLRSISDKPEVDDLYLNYAYIRLMKENGKCTSFFAKFVIDRYEKNTIETNKNRVIAGAIVAKCADKVQKIKSIDHYTRDLQRFITTMPADFSPAVFNELQFYLELLLDSVDWQKHRNAKNSLFKLLQLRQAISPALSSARFDDALIRDKEAKTQYIELEQLKNQYYKLNQPNRLPTEEEHLTVVAQQLLSAEKSIKLQYPQLTKYEANKIYALNDIQKKLTRKQQLIVIAQTKEHIISLHVTKRKSSVVSSLSNKEESKRLITQIREATISGEAVRQHSQTLSQRLPILQKLDTNKPKVLLHTDSHFSALPMSLLYDTDKNRWIIEKFMIERHLNLASIGETSRQRNHKFKTRLAIANPYYSKLKQKGKGPKILPGNLQERQVDRFSIENGNLSSKFISDNETFKIERPDIKFSQASNTTLIDAVSKLSPLRETMFEAEALIAGTTGMTRILKRDFATEVNIKAQFNTPWDIVMFSTHTLFPDNNLKMDYPALALTPNSHEPINNGLLSAAEIAHLNLNNSWVILAACDTSRSIGKRNHLGSLLNSFLLAGAHSILASHWKVNSNDTLEFITTLSKELDGVTISASNAVWKAKLKLLKSDRHPRLWSAFDMYY